MIFCHLHLTGDVTRYQGSQASAILFCHLLVSPARGAMQQQAWCCCTGDGQCHQRFILCAQLPVGVVRAGQHATLAVHPADPPVAGGCPLRAPHGAAVPAAARCYSADALSGSALRGAMSGNGAGEADSGREPSQGQAECGTDRGRLSTPSRDASCEVVPNSGGEAAPGGLQGGSAGEGRASGEDQRQRADQEAGDLGVERDRQAQRLRQRPAPHPKEAYREPWPLRARGSDSLHVARLAAPVQPHAAAAGAAAARAESAGNGQGVQACSNGGSAQQCGGPPRALEVPEYGTGLEFSNTNGSGRGHPGDPPGPPPAPDGGAAAAGAGLHWDPEPARWELRSRSAPPGALAACSPPNSRKVLFSFSLL